MGALPLVNRREELAWLEQRLDTALTGTPRLALVAGEPGVGKSRLVRHAQRAGQDRGFEVLAGRCREHVALPYLPFTGALLPRLVRTAANEGTAIERLLGHEVPTSDAPPMPEHEETALFATVASSTILLARHRPLLVIVEDLHWADAPTLDLFGHLAVEIADAALAGPIPVVLLATYRVGVTGRVASELMRLRREDITEELTVRGLDRPAVGELVEALGISRPSRVLEAAVHTATAGNPLFVENLVHQLQRSGTLIERGGETVPSGPLEAVGPKELTDAVQERLASESNEGRDVLTCLACLDRSVTAEEAAAASGIGGNEIEHRLEAYARSGLLLREGDRYQFAHQVYARVVYNDLAPTERNRLHQRIADWLGAHPTSSVLELAHHLVAAGSLADSQAVLERARAAGDHAWAILAWDEAARWYDVAGNAALEQGAPGVDVADLRYRAGVAHLRNMDSGPGRAALEEAADRYRAAGDLSGEAQALTEMAHGALTTVTMGEELDVGRLEAAVAQLEGPEPALCARALAHLAEAYWMRGDIGLGVTTARRALDLGRRAPNHGACALAQVTMATIAWMRLDLRAALAALTDALEHARADDDPWYEGVVLPRIALTRLWLGELDAARATAETASEVAGRVGDRAEQTFAAAALIGVAAARGDFETTERLAEEAWTLLRSSRYVWAAPFFLPTLADARSRRGAVEAANSALERWAGLEAGPVQLAADAASVVRQLVRTRAGLSVGTTLGDQAADLDATWPVTLGTVALFGIVAEIGGGDDGGNRLGRVERALEDAATGGMLVTEGPTFLLPRVQARVAWLRGREDDADRRYRDAIATAEHLGMEPELTRACDEHAQLLEARGAREEARASAARAAALRERIDARWAAPARLATSESTSVVLFTDIVGSTRLTELLGDAAYRARADRLDRRLRSTIRECGGHPEEGITLGDGVVALFTSARDAIACGTRAHESARACDLELRAGLHAGDVHWSPAGIRGGTVNIAARVCERAGAGETLVSEVVRGLARTSADVAFEDRGEHELKGVGDPQRLFVVVSRTARSRAQRSQ